MNKSYIDITPLKTRGPMLDITPVKKKTYNVLHFTHIKDLIII